MRLLGELGLHAALVGSSYATFAAWMGSRPGWEVLRRGGMWAAIGSLLGLTITMAVLAWALVAKDYRLEYVAHYTSETLPWTYALSALWVGQAGSLLLWTWFQVAVALLFAATTPRENRLASPALGYLMAVVSFLIAILIFVVDPLKVSVVSREDGLGLSPLLQHPSMLIHPPVVFLAYALWSVPCAVALSALSTGELGRGWTRIARPWGLAAWTILGSGILLGAHWAYQELGWGGYWSWDPVENGSLLPWLTGTASIHGILAWRQRGSMKKLALATTLLTYSLCLFATFLTRSGIFSSVHAFSESPLGWLFLGLQGVLLVGGCGALVVRRGELHAETSVGSVFAREALILGTSYLLLLFTGIVLVGTLWIPLSQALTGRMMQVGPEFYSYVLVPVGLFILTATALMPILRWGAGPGPEMGRSLFSSGLGGLGGVAAGAYAGMQHPVPLAVAGLLAFMLTATLWPRRTGPVAAAQSSWWLMWPGTRRQRASHLIHLALGCVALGIAGSSYGARRTELDLQEGEVVEWNGWRIEYQRLIQRRAADKLVAEAELRVSRGSGPPALLRPARHWHWPQREWTTEVAIHHTGMSDFYTILHAGLGEGRIAVTLIDHPWVGWIWLGGCLAVVGAAWAAWPERRRSVSRGEGYQRGRVYGHGTDMLPRAAA